MSVPQTWQELRDQPIALKEWSAVVGALIAGQQVLVLRKGGVAEAGFAVKARQFYLFPTHFHQGAEKLRLEAGGFLDSDVTTDLSIEAVARLEDAFEVADRAALERLAPHTLLSIDELRRRYSLRPDQALYGLLLRVHRLEQAFTLPWHKSYGGCRSWVPLRKPPALAVGGAALSDGAFSEAAQSVRSAARGTAP